MSDGQSCLVIKERLAQREGWFISLCFDLCRLTKQDSAKSDELINVTLVPVNTTATRRVQHDINGGGIATLCLSLQFVVFSYVHCAGAITLA